MEYKTKLIGNTANNDYRLHTEFVAPLKYLIGFWRSLDLYLMNNEIELDLPWTRYCIITKISRTPAVAANLNANLSFSTMAENQSTAATFQINNPKIFARAVTLSVNYNNFLENKKQRFKKQFLGTNVDLK